MADKTEKAKMLAGELYRSADAALVRERRHAQQFLARYNAISDGDPDLLLSMLRDFMGAVGERTVVQPLFTCDYATISASDGMPLSIITASSLTVRRSRSATTCKLAGRTTLYGLASA
jgi:Maltose acetyltransferase